MMCSTCAKLAYQVTRKKCIKCQADVLNSLSVLCETCSAENKVCSVCVKHIDNSFTKKYAYAGCRACGK